MAYERINWLERVREFANRFTLSPTGNPNEFDITRVEGTVTVAGVPLSIANLNSIVDGIEQNNLFNLLLTPGRYKVTTFDDPTAGDITETIKLTSDNSTYATITTEFDLPTIGDITTTLVCADLGINNKVVTVFNIDGSITETGSEVV